jgi:hypothetical protein
VLVQSILLDVFLSAKEKILELASLSFILATLSYYLVEQIFRKTRKNKLLLTYLAPALCSILIVVPSFYIFHKTNGETNKAIERLHTQAYRTVDAEYMFEEALNSSNNGDEAGALQAIADAGYSRDDLCFGAVAVDHQDLCGDVFDSSNLSTDVRISAQKDMFAPTTAFLPSKQCVIAPKDLPIIDSNPEKAICTFGDTSATRYILLLGDSHAEMLFRAVDAIGKRYGYKVILLAGAGDDIIKIRLSPIGISPQSKYLDFLEKMQSYALELEKGAELTVIGLRHDSQIIYDDMVNLVPKFVRKPVVIEDNSLISTSVLQSCINHSVDCTFSVNDYYSNIKPLFDLHNDFPDLFYYIPMKSHFCDEFKCSIVVGSTIAYYNYSHISATYAITLTPYLDRQLRPFLEQ